jgi:hypothetical protein
MAGTIATLITQVAACSTLRDGGVAQTGSLEVLLEGIAQACDTPAPAVAAAIRANAKDLADAVTRGTSHVAVDLTDPAIQHVQRFLAMTRAKRAAQITAVQAALDQLVAQGNG